MEFGMPFDFDATAPDPEEYEYSASEERMVKASEMSNGVFPQVRMVKDNILEPSAYVGESLRVSPAAGLAVTVSKGVAMVEGTTYVNTEPKTIPFEQNNVQQVFDLVVELDLVNQKILAKKQLRGAGLAVTDAMIRTEYLYQICIATVTIPANASAVAVAGIKDHRLNTTLCPIDNKPLCGLVGSVMQADTRMISEQLYQQISENQATFDGWMSKTQAAFSAWQSHEKSNFNAWFASIQNILDGDVAANLASQIAKQGEQLTALDAAKAAKSITAPVTLTAAGWVEDAENGWWTQGISNPAIVDGRKVDLSASPAVVKQISEAGATLVLENNAGTATIYSLGAVPTVDLTIELIISEVTEQ